MKYAFCTCVQIGMSCMEAIYKIGGDLSLIITLKDVKSQKKSGRIYVDTFAQENDIPVVKINHVNDIESIDAIRKFNIDWLFIIGWSQIASTEVIETPKCGAIGAHPTLLPKGRGRASIPWAIIKGLDKTGITFFKLDEGVDTGMILSQMEIPLLQSETATTLYQKVNYAHESLIQDLYIGLEKNLIKGYSQNDEEATYWPGRKPMDGELNIYMSMDQVDKLVRGTTKPYPGAYIVTNGLKTIIWEGFKSLDQINNPMYQEIHLTDGFFYGTNFEMVKY